MSLNIWFVEDIRNALTSLDQASERFSELAERYGMNPEVARLSHEIYSGALGDVGAFFGIALQTITPRLFDDTTQVRDGTLDVHGEALPLSTVAREPP
jgi:hypothetical protein